MMTNLFFRCHWLSEKCMTTNDNRFYLWLSWKMVENQGVWYILTTMTTIFLPKLFLKKEWNFYNELFKTCRRFFKTPRRLSEKTVTFLKNATVSFYGVENYLFNFQVNPSLVSFTSKPRAASSSRILSLVAQSLLAFAFMRCSRSMSTTLP